MNGSHSRFKITFLQVLVAMAFLLSWHIATTTPLFAEPKKMQFFFSTPIDVLARTWRQLIGGEIWYHLGITLTETVLAFVFGATGGVLDQHRRRGYSHGGRVAAGSLGGSPRAS